MEEININELLSILNTSEKILKSNTEIENDISQNGGNVIYSYNNIIIATDITPEFYDKLKENNNIEFISDLPLKKQGDINFGNIGQFDTSKLVDIEQPHIDENKSGKSRKTISESNINKDINSVLIKNINLDLNLNINEKFNFEILTDGYLPIKYEFIEPTNFKGDLYLEENILKGKSQIDGKFEIKIKVLNNYGYDLKILTLNIYDPVKIINEKYNLYSKVNSFFSYSIENTGNQPFTYSVDNLPSGLTLNENIISGYLVEENVHILKINVSGLTSYDSKDLIINVGKEPIIISDSLKKSQQYTNFIYEIISNTNNNIYNILGILPEGLVFKNNIISGIPIYTGEYNLKIKATNPYGVTIKNLKILIYS